MGRDSSRVHPPKMVRIEIFIDEILCLMAVVSIKWLRVVMFRTQGLSRSAKTFCFGGSAKSEDGSSGGVMYSVRLLH